MTRLSRAVVPMILISFFLVLTEIFEDLFLKVVKAYEPASPQFRTGSSAGDTQTHGYTPMSYLGGSTG